MEGSMGTSRVVSRVQLRAVLSRRKFTGGDGPDTVALYPRTTAPVAAADHGMEMDSLVKRLIDCETYVCQSQVASSAHVTHVFSPVINARVNVLRSFVSATICSRSPKIQSFEPPFLNYNVLSIYKLNTVREY